jgi:superfamily II DNA or RNA helicase
MKAVISNRIYMEVTPDLQKSIDKELTYKIPTHNPLDPPQIICNMGIVRNGLISIPTGRMDLIPGYYDIIDKRIRNVVKFPEFKHELRASQKKVYDELDDSCIINAWVSWGKTFTALAIAAKLGQKTLVITHTVPLRNQWAKEVEKVFGISASIIGSGNWDVSGPIVIGNTQTLYRNLDKIHKTFGTLILDEMHHVSSPTFNRIIDSNYCRYKIGLSGTIERKDGKHVVFRDYFGNKLFQPPKENYMTPAIHIVRSEIRFQDGSRTPWANRVTALTMQDEYKHTVSMLAAAYAAKGHKVLVVSDRVSFLKACTILTGDKAICVTGDVPHEERETLVDEILYGDKNVLYGTQSIFSEGISVDTLSCLILGTPVNNEPLLTQLVGRVIRKKEGKLPPVIVDIHLKGNTAKKQASNRVAYYLKQGYHMKYV